MNISASAKMNHVSILPLAGIRPSTENELLYRPIDPDDPDVQALAESIRNLGIQEPIVVSADGFILSGHRRYVAAGLAGLTEAPCRVHSISRQDDHDGFVELLREFNRQRVKTFDESLREEIVSADPEEAYVSLLEHRQQILNDPPLKHASKPKSRYSNDSNSYSGLTNLMTRARLEEIIPWEAIHDPTRPVTLWRTHQHAGSFVRKQFATFLKDYWRDLQQSQPKHIEIIVEKNTVESIVTPVAMKYTIPVTSARGYCSIPPRKAIAERLSRSGKDRLVLLVVSDFDPDGEMIAASFARSMRDDFGIEGIDATKVALTAEQVRRFSLPPGGKAKSGSKNYAAFQKAYGNAVYELEALTPEQLQMLVTEAIESVVDREALNHEIEAEKCDAAELEILRRRLRPIMEAGQWGPDHA